MVWCTQEMFSGDRGNVVVYTGTKRPSGAGGLLTETLALESNAPSGFGMSGGGY